MLDFIAARDDGDGDGKNCKSLKYTKFPSKLHHQYSSTHYSVSQAHALPVTQPTVSRTLKSNQVLYAAKMQAESGRIQEKFKLTFQSREVTSLLLGTSAPPFCIQCRSTSWPALPEPFSFMFHILAVESPELGIHKNKHINVMYHKWNLQYHDSKYLVWETSAEM